MKNISKTNAVRIIDSLGIKYELAGYDHGEDHMDAISVAEAIEASPEIVFKTLVAHDEKNNIFVFCVPGNVDLNLKKAAVAAKVKKIDLINLKDLFPLTGYIRGGCSPIGMRKSYPTFIDEIATVYDYIYINAGTRGIQMKLTPIDLAKACDAQFADLI